MCNILIDGCANKTQHTICALQMVPKIVCGTMNTSHLPHPPQMAIYHLKVVEEEEEGEEGEVA